MSFFPIPIFQINVSTLIFAAVASNIFFSGLLVLPSFFIERRASFELKLKFMRIILFVVLRSRRHRYRTAVVKSIA